MELVYRGLTDVLTDKSTRDPDNKLSTLATKRVHQTTKGNDKT